MTETTKWRRVGAPGYWMNETSGVLRPAVEAYLSRNPMTPDQIAAMRAYLRQWIASEWRGPGILQLRDLVDAIQTAGDISVWLNLAEARGIDPL
jgi:hypothetical protein